MDQIALDAVEAEQTHVTEDEETMVAETAEAIEIKMPPANVCLARQAIFDEALQVYAYELLYADNNPPDSGQMDDNAASSQVMINAFLDVGIEILSENKPSFIPVSRDFLVGRLPLPFPPQAVVLQLPATLAVDDELTAGLRHFSSAGYLLALDGVTFEATDSALLELVDIVKVAIDRCDPDTLADGVKDLATRGVQLIAQHVESRDEFSLCVAAGFTHFQGGFVATPEAVSSRVLKPSSISLMKILQLLENPDCDIAVLENLISQDVTLSYKILRIINSAFYGFRRKIDSVKQAVVSLGLKVIRDWFIVISLTDIEDKPRELIFLTLQRARMMQSLAEIMSLNKDTGFTIGLFSSIDAIMDQPMDEILQALPLSDEIVDALSTREGPFGQLLNVVLHYERGDWKYINSKGFETSELSTFYFEAMYWARGLFDQLEPQGS